MLIGNCTTVTTGDVDCGTIQTAMITFCPDCGLYHDDLGDCVLCGIAEDCGDKGILKGLQCH